MSQLTLNSRDTNWLCEGPSPEAVKFHRGLVGYEPTELIDLPMFATELGVGKVLAKNEAGRLGLPAFKALGASWAIQCALADVPEGAVVTITTATDGNHGRAVSRFARLFGHKARIVVPSGVHPTAIQAIVDEGAEVSQVDGSYDDAVEAATNLAKAPGHILVQDMAWDGYEEIPTRIVEGYATMFVEIDDQLKANGINHADLVIVPAGVGSLLQGALQHYRSSPSRLKTKIVSVEPDTAACIVKSIETQSPSSVPTSTTVMAGLNCGTISTLAWPYVQNGLDGAVVISDSDDIKAAHDLADQGVAAGPCGAAGLAGMRNIDITKLGLDKNSVVVILITEGSDANPVPEL